MDILIVEDDIGLCRMLKIQIASKGHRVTVCENGPKAWDKFRQFGFDLILADWEISGTPEWNLIHAVRTSVTDRYPYIIVMSTEDRKTDVSKALETGADDWIIKPFPVPDLDARIRFGQRIVRLEEMCQTFRNERIRNQTRTRVILDSLPQKLAIIDSHYTIVSANNAFLKDIDMSCDDVVGQSCLQERLWRSSASFIRVLQDHADSVFMKAVPENRFEAQIVHDGKTDIFQFLLLPIESELGDVYQAAILCRDVTVEQRRVEEVGILNQQFQEAVQLISDKNQRLEETVRRLKETRSHMLQSEKMASIGQLAAGVAHEINNPVGFVSSNLNALKGYHEDIQALITAYQNCCTQMMSADAEKQKIRDQILGIRELERKTDIAFVLEEIPHILRESREGIDRIKKIVRDLKDFSHPGEDVSRLADVNHHLDSTLNIVWNELKYKATVIRDYGDIPQVKCYPQQLNQVFMNILVNAVQSIEKQGEIHISTRVADGYAEVRIRDTGCGIPEDHLNRIFDPFFTTKEVGKGTGLGLNVAYNIIRKHKGTIQVESTPGVGSAFIIRVPVDGPDSAAETITWD